MNKERRANKIGTDILDTSGLIWDDIDKALNKFERK